MDDKIKLTMDEILNRYDKSQEKTKQKQAEIKLKEKKFLDSFKHKRTHTICSCLKKIVKTLEERGHKCEINEHLEKTQENLGIYMKVCPSGIDFSLSAEVPQITFSAISYEQRIVTRISTMMPGRGGEGKNLRRFSIDEITTETIDEEVSIFLEKVFKNAAGAH